jgi:long-chain acyl-CoA synthetase
VGDVGYLDEAGYLHLCALVQPRQGAALDADALRQFLRASLAGFKLPRRIEFRNELPREDSGKLFKRKLREPYWRGAGRRI